MIDPQAAASKSSILMGSFIAKVYGQGHFQRESKEEEETR